MHEAQVHEVAAKGAVIGGVDRFQEAVDFILRVINSGLEPACDFFDQKILPLKFGRPRQQPPFRHILLQYLRAKVYGRALDLFCLL